MEKEQRYSKAIAFLFGALVLSFTLASIFSPKRKFSENENRLLAEKPEFSFDKLFSGEFATSYENYITDQFFLRDNWIQVKTLAEIGLQKKDVNGVYLAKDGYLIERHEESSVDETQLNKNMDRLVNFAEKYSALLGKDHVKVMLVPTASEVYADKLPAFASGFDQKGMLDAMFARLPEGVGVDVRDVLTEHADEYIYYKTDHHWTTLGAYYAYTEWAKASGLLTPALSEIDQVVVSEEFYGTIYSKLNLKLSKDTMYRFDFPQVPNVKVSYDMQNEYFNTMYMDKYLDMKDKYCYYLDGNHALVEIVNEDKTAKTEAEGKAPRKLLIIKDSYSHCFTPLTVGEFDEVFLVDFRYYNMPISMFIEERGVTDILVLYNGITFAKDKSSGAFNR